MARIWYSVCGEGLGHAIRSKTVIDQLLKEHEIAITGYGKSIPYLRGHYGRGVTEIRGSTWVHRRDTISILRSAAKFFLTLPGGIMTNIKAVSPLIESFKPDIILTDFESTAHYYAKHRGIPAISIDNIQVFSRSKIDFPRRQPFYFGPGMDILYPEVDRYFILDYAGAKPKDTKTTHMTDPLIRTEVRSLKSTDKGKVLVYQTADTNRELIPTLKRHDREFHVYGMGKEGKEGNITFRAFDERQFFEDLADCAYVITNGGFTLITEAIHLRKPVLSMPIHKYHEQQYNAYSLEKKGWGKAIQKPTYDALQDFEKNHQDYRKNLAAKRPWNDRPFFQKLDRTIKELVE